MIKPQEAHTVLDVHFDVLHILIQHFWRVFFLCLFFACKRTIVSIIFPTCLLLLVQPQLLDTFPFPVCMRVCVCDLLVNSGSSVPSLLDLDSPLSSVARGSRGKPWDYLLPIFSVRACAVIFGRMADTVAKSCKFPVNFHKTLRCDNN